MSETVVQGDCLDVMRGLAEGSVDAVVTDPPYGQTNEAYDRGIDPAVWAECFRVCKPNAALLSFAGGPTYHRIASGIEAAGWRVRQMWGWVYRDGMITSAYPREGKDRLAPAMDPICYATRGKILLRVVREGTQGWDRLSGRSQPYDVPRLSERSTFTRRARQGVGRYPRTIIAADGVEGFQYFVAPRASWRGGEKCGHPNQKPVALMRWLLSKLPPGGLVLDPFAGSGTTGVACVEEGFRFLGIEREADYVEIARRRLAAAGADLGLFAGMD